MAETPEGPYSNPWHQRFRPVAALRHRVRSAMYSLVRKVLATDDGRLAAAETLRGVFPGRPQVLDAGLDQFELPYPELARCPVDDAPVGQKAVFITARFRSGSTLLWSLYRNVPRVTAYYEPLNERR